LKQSCFGRYVKCLANLWRFVCKKSAPLQIDAEDSDIADLIEKIKNKKCNYSPLLPAQKQAKKSLVLDLDETLIHTTFNKPPKYDF
jgi:TFIIF-interacting CTD phosphatase-like protein